VGALEGQQELEERVHRLGQAFEELSELVNLEAMLDDPPPLDDNKTE
jgi:hypothetical protein